MTDERLRRMVLGRLAQLRQSEKLDREALAGLQSDGLRILAGHAARFSPGFAARLEKSGLAPKDLGDLPQLARLEPLARKQLQQGGDVFCRAIPETHQPTSWAETTGSSGQPVRVMHTLVTQVEWLALTLREHEWHKSDIARPLASIRGTIPGVRQLDGWGPAVSLLGPSGPAMAKPSGTPAGEIAKLLAELQPGQIVIYPTVLDRLCAHVEEHGLELKQLQRIRTIGETLRPGIRERAEQIFGVPVTDIYSTRELGLVAIQCPESGLYHAMENLIVEVLDAQGRPCDPGEEGELIVSDLRNFATPLIRYRIGDRAIAGGACSCGRSLPTLERVMGRVRNMVAMRDGTRGYPSLATGTFWQHGPVNQFQFVQHALDDIEVRLGVRHSPSAEEERAMGDAIHKMLGHDFPLRFTYFDDVLPEAPGGKSEEFVCLV